METIARTASSLYIAGGTLPPGALSYVPRQADQNLLTALLQREYCYVLNARQMGKSSLCVRTIAHLQQEGVRTVFLDLTKFGSGNLSAEQWYAALLSEVGRELGLRAQMLRCWKDHTDLPPVQRLFNALTEVGLPAGEGPIVVFVDEIDVTRSLPFNTDEFFAGIRQCFVARATDPSMDRLSFCLLGTATPADLIQDTRVTPFNIGSRIPIRDFTAEEAAPLHRGLGENGAALLDRILHWTGGQPYLTQRLCRTAVDAAVATPADIDRLCSDLFLTHTAQEADDNLALVRSRLLRSDVDLAALLDLYGQVRAGRKVKDDETSSLVDILKLSGVVKVTNGLLQVRNRIYAQVFDERWVATHMPDAELQRQRAAYRRGLVRAAGLAAVVLALVGGLAIYAFILTGAARRSATEARRSLYAADIGLIQRQWENNNVSHILALLEQTRTNPDSGFESVYWKRLRRSEILTFDNHHQPVTSVSFSPDGQRIATGSFDNTASVWDAHTGEELLTLKGHTALVSSVAFSPDGQRIVTGSWDNSAKVWDAHSGGELLTLKGHADTVQSVCFSPDGQRIATGSMDNTAKVWNAHSGKELLTLKGHTYAIWSVGFSPDGLYLATGSGDNTAKIWDTRTGGELFTLRGHADNVTAVCFAPDGQRIVTGSWDNTARVWDAHTGKQLLTLTGHLFPVSSARFSPDGQYIVTGSIDSTAKVWDSHTAKELRTLTGHTSLVWSVSFSPDGKRIVTGSWDNTVKVWLWDSKIGSGM
ncbi:MAG: AAA-like domain-containing protein [Armatimonadota bacterium]|nr:AAA-like domain-containing protein [Armatimonadota bacterium]